MMELLAANPKTVTYHKIKPQHRLEEHFKLYKQKGVLVTVDDGDLSFYEHMFPLLKQYKLPAILFIITDLIGTNKPFWWDELHYLLGPEAGEKKVWEVKDWPNSKRVAYLQQLRQESAKPPLAQQQLSVAQLLEMQEAGVVIANHSHTHPMFNQCTEEELRAEFKQSKRFFETNKLKGWSLFAYPNGNYNALAEKVAREEGVAWAFLFDHQLPASKLKPLRMSRLSVTDQTSGAKLKFILSGWHSKALPLIKQAHKLMHA